MKNERAVTLITLVVTVVILIILTFTITVNMDQYGNQRKKSDFEVDLQKLKEQVSQYYAANNKLPIINPYTNISTIKGFTNINDNDKYYVIDLNQLKNVTLNYGADYSIIRKKNVTEEITNLFDVYIINEQSHTIYYPKGVMYNGEYHYTSNDVYNNIKVEGYVNKPKLAEGMTPVKFTLPTATSAGTVNETTENDQNWYQYGTTYETRRWANAKTADGSMWVWIPRYAYKITYYTDSTKTVKSQTKTQYGSVDIVFLIGTTDKYYDENGATKTAKRVKSKDEVADTMADYYVHPVFTNESSIGYANGGWDEELTGIWVAKFEAGYVGKVNQPNTAIDSKYNYTIIEGNTGSQTNANYYYGTKTASTKMKYPTFQANRASYNNISVGDAFTLCRALTNSGNPYNLSSKVDSHLMKNSEWGAVIYLSYSKYGIEGKEIYINNITANNTNTIYAITGYGATNTNTASVTNTNLDGLLAGTEQGNWQSIQGQKASTTGNITGIYDMNGGLWESVAGIIDNVNTNLATYAKSLIDDTKTTITTSQQTITIEKSTKYVTVYPHDTSQDGNTSSNDDMLSQNNFKNNKNIFGDAIRETTINKAGTNESDWGKSAWNNNYSYFPTYSKFVFYRGGRWADTAFAGGFTFNRGDGISDHSNGFRAVVVP